MNDDNKNGVWLVIDENLVLSRATLTQNPVFWEATLQQVFVQQKEIIFSLSEGK